MTYKEQKIYDQLMELLVTVTELKAENKLLKSFNDRLLQALPIHSVVRGGVNEAVSFQVTDEQNGTDITTAKPPSTPTETLESEGEEKCVCGACGKPLTLVRPGKYQCDNRLCQIASAGH